VAYQWYKKWEQSRGDGAKSSLKEDFSNTFLDHFIPQEVREVKVEEFINLKQGKM